MSSNRPQRRRAEKTRRRQARQNKNTQGNGGPLLDAFPGGWLNDLDDFPAPPDESLLDTSRCSVGPVCVGCGSGEDLHAVTSAFSRPGGYDVACATLCDGCDGRSFVHLLGDDQLPEAFERHASH